MLTGQTRSERRALDKFQAFLLGYNGDHAAASAAWEVLDELGQAARQAREAGEIERAYDLLRRAKEPIPEDLATAVHALRRLDKLVHKHDSLKLAEKRAIVEQIMRVQAALSAEPDESPDE
jgi:predicted ATPase